MGRILIFTGKGGVGKTSVAAAHARYSALQGKKTLIVSTDMAHNLSDIFDVEVGKTAAAVMEGLDVLEIDPNYIIENEFKDMQAAMIEMVASSGIPKESLDALSMMPGQDELFSLMKILEIYESDVYDRIIVDCAPTGETLSLLKFPELLSWYMEKFLPVGKVALRVLAPVSKTFFKIQLPDQAAVTDIEKLFIRLNDLQSLLKDREVTSIRLVAMPEKMVVEETKRNYMYMNLYDFHVDGVYINRILPKGIDNPFFDEWLAIQAKYTEELEAVFAGMPVYKIPWFDSDLNGLEGIDRMADEVLKGTDVFASIETGHQAKYEKTEDGYRLTLHLPFANKGDLDMHESETDIIIKIGNFKRNIPKPGSLRDFGISGAKLDGGLLNIHFTKLQ